MSIVTGAVNGVATTANVATTSNLVTIPFFPGGTNDTLDVETDGSGLFTPNHRVAFIAGNVSGRDHFPWPAEDKPSGVYPAQYFPISLSLDDACKWVWRVKKWQLTGTMTFDVTFGGDTETYTATHNYPINGYTVDGDITEESQILVMLAVAVTSGGSSTITGGFPLGSVEFFENGTGILDPTYPSITYGDAALWPEVDFVTQIEGSTDVDDADSAFNIRFTLRNPDEDAIGDQVTITDGMSLDGNSVDLYYQIATDVGTATISNVTASLSLDPLEFWPYATTTGAAVYNTSTGAQINEPLS